MPMKAVLCKSLDGYDALVIDDIDIPEPAPDEVLVRVTAAALNFMDTLITRGKYQYKPELPFSPSGEICGIVEKTGTNATRLKPGDKVMGYIGWGGASELVAVSEDRLVIVPDGVADTTAAGLSITYGTALHGLRDRADLKAGEVCAILGASGGAGLAAVEIAKLMGARVIAVASSPEKLEVCRQAGADDLLDYKTENLRDGLKRLTDGRGVDVIYDCVGGEHSEAAIRATAWGGRLLVIGFAAGDIPKLPLNLLLVKGAAAIGVFWGRFVDADPTGYRDNMSRLMTWVAEGRLKPRVDHVLPLSKARKALGLIAERKAKGKIVLTP